MNKLNNDFNRGFSLKNDDLRFVDAAVRKALNDICRALAPDHSQFILFGCDVSYSGTTATVTEGSIFFNEEIWHVDAHTFTITSPMLEAPIWAFSITYDANGVKLDKDLAPHNTYIVRKAVGHFIGAAPANDGTASFPDMLRLSTFPVSYTYALTYLNGADPTVSSPIVSKVQGIVTLGGAVKNTITAAGVECIAFPIGFHLANEMTGYIPGFNTTSGLYDQLRYEISFGGVLKFFSTTTQQYIIKLAGIPGFIAAY